MDQRFDFHMVDGSIYIPAFRYALPSDDRYTLPTGIHISFELQETAVVFHGWIEVRDQQEPFPQSGYLTDAGMGADRAGSGNLNRGVEWIVRATSA